MNTQINARYFFFAILLIVGILNIAILWPFLATLVLAVSFSVVFYPLYQWFYRQIPWLKGTLASLLTIISFVLIICGPLLLLGTVVFQQSIGLYDSLSEYEPDYYIQQINTSINRLLPTGFTFSIESKIADIVALVSNNIAGVFTATVNTIFSFFLMLLAMFFFLKDGDVLRKKIIFLSPLANTDDERVLVKLRDSINGVIAGHLFVGLIQGLVMGIGLALLGVPHSALLGVLSAIASLIPTVGTAIISIPVIVYLFATGDVYAGIGVIVWASLIVGMIDNILHPIIIGKKVDLPVLVVLLAVLGGGALLGPVGILIGPLLVSLFHALLSMYSESVS